MIHYEYAILKCFDNTQAFNNINDSKDQYHINSLRSKFNANFSLRSMLGELCNILRTFVILLKSFFIKKQSSYYGDSVRWLSRATVVFKHLTRYGRLTTSPRGRKGFYYLLRTIKYPFDITRQIFFSCITCV